MVQKKIRLLTFVISGIISTSIILPSMQTYATTLNPEQKIEVNDDKLVGKQLTDKEKQELNDWINDLKNDKELNKDRELAERRAKLGIVQFGKGKFIVVRAEEWMVKHWPKIVEKSPKWLKPYLKFDTAMKAMRYYVNISDTVDVYVWRVLKYILPGWIPDPVVGGLKNTIMGLLPF